MKKTLSAAIALLVLICCFSIVPLYASAATTNENFTFELNSNGDAYILNGTVSGLSGEIIVPDRYNGLPVTTIASNAFGYCGKVTSITIPETVTTIEGVAFQKCTSLITVNLPKTIQSINTKAFDFCYSLQNITIDGDKNGHGDPIVNAVGSVLGEGYFVVDGVLFSNYNQYVQNNLSVKKIDHNCLEVYPSGRAEKTYVIPTNTMVIKSEAFSSVKNLGTIVVPASVTNFYARSFRGLGDAHEKSITIVMQHDAYPVDMSAYTFQNLYPGSKVVLKNASLVDEFNKKYSTIVYDFLHDEPGVTFVSAPTPTTSLSIDKTSLSLKINTTGVIAPTQVPYNTTDSISFKSSDSSIASVDNYGCGKVTANGVGTANITVTSGNKSVVCKVTVTCDHESTSIVNASEAKCNSDGYTGDKVCDICNTTLVKGSTIKAPGCKYITGTSKPATCTENGYTGEVYCSVCGKVKSYSTTIYSPGHSYGEWIVDIKGSCTEDGEHHKVCSSCNDIVTETIVASGHKYNSWVVDKAATCTSDGSRHKICSSCGDTITETLRALGHDFSTSWSVDKTANCKEEGSKSHHCSRCSAKTDVTVIEKTSHIYSAWVTDKASTCAEEGLRHKTCSSCGEIFSEVIAKKAHRYSPWEITKEVTCTKNGLRAKTCTNCGEVVSETIVASGHEYSSKWTIDKPATCTEEGMQSRHCKNCSATTDKTVTEAKGHNPSNWITDKEPSVYSPGLKTKKCTRCGKVLETLTLDQYKPSLVDAPTLKNTTKGVYISWKTVAGGDVYRVYRKTGSTGEFTCIGSTKKDTYTDKTAKSGKTYYYVISAANEAGETVSLKNTTGLVTAIERLSAPKVSTLKNTTKGVYVKWNKISGADKYVIYRKTGSSGEWKKLTTIKKGSTVSYTDKTAKSGKTYYYKIYAYSGSYKSSYYTSDKIKFLASPELNNAKSTKSGVKVTWDKVSGASGYYVYRKTSSGDWKRVGTVKSGKTVSFTDKSAKKGVTYYYTVAAYSGSTVSSKYSPGLKVKDKY